MFGITNLRYNEQISPIPWHFVKSRFYGNRRLFSSIFFFTEADSLKAANSLETKQQAFQGTESMAVDHKGIVKDLKSMKSRGMLPMNESVHRQKGFCVVHTCTCISTHKFTHVIDACIRCGLNVGHHMCRTECINYFTTKYSSTR